MHASSIPKTIHQIWFQGLDHLPSKYRRYQSTWRNRHPAWEFHYWDAVMLRNHIAVHHPHFLAQYESFPRDRQRMNTARYCLLKKLGGVYIDMDIECLRPIDSLLDGHDLMLSQTVGYNNAMIGSSPEHPLWRALFRNLHQGCTATLEDVGARMRSSESMQISATVGPRFFSMSVTQSGVEDVESTLRCPGYFFEDSAPVSDKQLHRVEEPYGRHDMDMKWQSPLRRVISRVSKVILPLARVVDRYSND